MLDRLWWRLNSAMDNTGSDRWWRILLFLRDDVVYCLMLWASPERRRTHAEIGAWEDD